ncbi:streptophobe family protein [Actinoplanes sp. NPDC051470]|uniref:streptophobe family protein n=1 Tax=Actinoplanes sp. NPDC051470 TaxID=3157224 RepID=UPI00343C8A88
MTTRDIYRGLVAAAGALSAMAGTAVAGLLLLDADRAGRLGRLTAAVVAMAAGGPATIDAVPAGGLPIAVQGQFKVMPLGVSLVGAVVLGTLLLRHGRSGLLVRGISAVVAFTAGVGVVAMAARGRLTLPSGSARAAADGMGACAAGTGTPLNGALPIDQFQAGFSVSTGSTVAGAAVGALAVVGLCWLTARFSAIAGTLRAARWTIAGATVVCVLAAWAWVGPQVAGGLLLVLPLVVSGALLHGLGVPWSFSADGVLACVLDGGWSPPGRGAPAVLSAVVLLACGIAVAVAARTGRDRACGPLRRAAGLAVRLGPVVAAVLVLLTLLSRVSAELGVRAFVLAVPILDVRLTANPWGALGLGLGAGAIAGFAGSLLVDAFRRRTSVGRRP